MKSISAYYVHAQQYCNETAQAIVRSLPMGLLNITCSMHIVGVIRVLPYPDEHHIFIVLQVSSLDLILVQLGMHFALPGLNQ